LRIAFSKSEQDASQMMNESLDVFCTINEEGNFVYVSAACKTLGYIYHKISRKAYMQLIYEEDIQNYYKS
jgi:PAS domain S-box-containing protein